MHEGTLVMVDVPVINEEFNASTIVPSILDGLSPEAVVGELDYMFGLKGLRSEVQAAYLQV